MSDLKAKLQKMYKNFEINLTKNLPITEENKKNCRILKFSSSWTHDEIISEISKLDGKIYKNLFLFEIKNPKENEAKIILGSARNFCKRRPLVMRLLQGDEKKEKIFYINEGSTEWIEIMESKEEKFEKIDDFSSFFRWFETKKNLSINMIVTEACKLLSNPELLILRYFTLLKPSFESYFHLLSHCAANYSKAQFLSALGIPFSSDERFLDEFQANFIRKTFTKDKKSILESAIGNENKEVLKYLISYCLNLIRQLPFEHQRKINKELIRSNKLDILCDLLEFCDFIFPSDFNLQKFSHEKLEKIVSERQNLHNAINNENYDEIYKFIKTKDLKLAKNIHNKTALHTALTARKFEMYFYLKSLGFKSDDCNGLLEELENDKRFIKARDDSMKKNMKGSKSGDNMAINFLTARSKIFGKHSSGQHDKIRTWFEAIDRIKQGRSLLNAASQCNKLMIIFDFESYDVERVDLDSPDANGIMYPGKKLVIVAAKHSTDEQEQKVKGVLAHELCHYVMKLVFENAEQPYLNEHDERFKIYKIIVDDLRDEFSDKDKDDRCEEIISSVFRLYKPKDFHAELIVRPIQILARYDNDEVKVDQLVRRYDPLFDFFDEHIIQSMDELDLRQREAVRKLNNSAGMTESFLNVNLKFSVSKELENVMKKTLVVARSNVPILLLTNFYDHLRIKNGNLIDTRNVFISSEELKYFKNRLKELLEEFKDLKVFIELSNGNQEIFQNLQLLPLTNFFFITPSVSQSEELLKTLKEKLKVTEKLDEIEINYEWKGLTKHTQNEILQAKFNFQNNPGMTLKKLLKNPKVVIDAELLNAILVDSKFSINSTEEADDHFIDRKFVWKNQTITLEELLEKTKDEKYVLISDVAGTGKSWAMKNISKELSRLYPTEWVTFVDLKQLIPAFKKQKQQPSFEDFIVNEVMEGKLKFEVEIFKQKYKTGNSLIFFDGFDEIAPDSATIVKELIKSFKFNLNSGSRSYHNQLWISTRDFFEIDICEELDTSFTCKLADFTVDDGIDLISNIWRLHDERNRKEPQNKVSNNKEIDKQLAYEVCLKIKTMDLERIGQPLIYKMLAEVTKNDKEKFVEGKFSSYELFEEFWKICEEDWSHKKGEYKMRTCTENKKNDLHFHRVHQLKAMQKFMPGKLKYCDIDPENEEWEDEDLIGCGLMTKTGKNYFFIHETFSEFFVAQFILRILSKPKVDENIFEFIEEVVANPKREVIRMFLNEGLATEQKIKTKFDEKAQKIEKTADCFKNSYEILTKNLQNLDELKNFWFLILKHCNYGELVNVLAENIKNLVFMHETKISERSMKIFLDFFTSNMDVPTIKEALTKIGEKSHPEIIQEVLNFKNNLGENIFFVLQKTKTINEKMFEKFVKILEEFLTEAEIAEKMMMCSKSGESVFHLCVRLKNIQNLKAFWTGFEKFLGAEKFKKLLKQKTIGLGDTILHDAAYHSESVDFHEAFWSLLLKTFGNQKQELKNFVWCQNLQNYNFIFKMVQDNNLNVLNWTLNKLKSTFDMDEIREFLRMKGFEDMNLLQNAAQYSKRLKTHQALWTFILELFSNEILEFVAETDDYGDDLLHYIVRYSTAEIFNFYIQELEKFASKEEMRKILCCLNHCGRNILQQAAIYDDNLELHESLWKVIRKYFNSSEILEFLSLHDYWGDNFLKYIELYETKEVVEFSQAEVIKEITKICPNDFKMIEKLKTAIENKKLGKSWNQEELKVLTLNWIYQGSSSFTVTKDMEKTALNTDKKVHEESWKFILEKYNEAEIKEILLKENIFGVNFVHQVLGNENLEVIQQTFEHIKKVADLKEMFNSTNSNGQSLLQYSACEAVDISVYKYLWELLKTSFSSDDIFDILGHKDKFGNNLLLHVARFSTEDVAEWTWKQIDEDLKIESQKLKTQINERNMRGDNVLQVCCIQEDIEKLRVFWTRIKKAFNCESEFKDFVKQKELKNQETILHQMAWNCEDIEFHETFWELLLRTFEDRNELKDFLLSHDNVGDNFLFDLIRYNTSSDVIKFTFEIYQKTFIQAQFDEILKSTGLNDKNLVHQALRYTKDIKIHKILWKYLLSCESFTDLLASVDSTGWNVLNFTADHSTAEILDFMYEELEKLNDKEKVKKIILSGINFLHFAAAYNRNLDFQKSIWKLARTFLNKADFLHLIHWVDSNENNLLQYAVKRNTKEVVEFTWNQLKTFMTATEKKNYLRKSNGEGLSLIGIATKYNRPSEIIDLVRSIMKAPLRSDDDLFRLVEKDSVLRRFVQKRL